MVYCVFAGNMGMCGEVEEEGNSVVMDFVGLLSVQGQQCDYQ